MPFKSTLQQPLIAPPIPTALTFTYLPTLGQVCPTSGRALSSCNSCSLHMCVALLLSSQTPFFFFWTMPSPTLQVYLSWFYLSWCVLPLTIMINFMCNLTRLKHDWMAGRLLFLVMSRRLFDEEIHILSDKLIKESPSAVRMNATWSDWHVLRCNQRMKECKICPPCLCFRIHFLSDFDAVGSENCTKKDTIGCPRSQVLAFGVGCTPLCPGLPVPLDLGWSSGISESPTSRK